MKKIISIILLITSLITILCSCNQKSDYINTMSDDNQKSDYINTTSDDNPKTNYINTSDDISYVQIDSSLLSVYQTIYTLSKMQ